MMQATLVTHGSEQEGRQKSQYWMLFLNMSTGVIWGTMEVVFPSLRNIKQKPPKNPLMF